MGLEVERKFLLRSLPEGIPLGGGAEIHQGYLAAGPGSEVRLRRRDGVASLTVKTGQGLVRGEWEIELTTTQLESLWSATEGRRVEKVRHRVALAGGSVAEVDRYGGHLAGLLTVEVELPSEEEANAFAPPPWFGEEVTGDPRYSNRHLAEAPGPPTR